MLLLLLLSCFSHVWLCATPEMAAHQAYPSLGFSRQEHWSGLPLPSPMHESEKSKWSRSVVSNSSRPHGLQPTRLLRPWDLPGKSTGVGCHCLLSLSLSLCMYVCMYMCVCIHTHGHALYKCAYIYICELDMMKNDFFLSKMFKSHFLSQEITGMFFWKKLNRPREVLRSVNRPDPGGPESTNKKVKERERGWCSLVYVESQ